MSPSHPHRDPPRLELANANRAAFPLEQLIPYEGRYVAWSADSTRILANGADLFEVEGNVVASGLDPSQVIYEFVPPPD